jgi:HEPN domain-containing protein
MDELKRQLIQEWVTKADEDLQAARLLGDAKLIAPALFHCQQAAEKAIKGFLCASDFPLEKTHDLVRLLELAQTRDTAFSALIDNADLLNSFAVEVRYPGAGELPPFDLALTVAVELCTVATQRIRNLLDNESLPQ